MDERKSVKIFTGILPLFVWVGIFDSIVGDVNHLGIFYFVYRVRSDQCDSSTLRNEDHIITLQEPHETWKIFNINLKKKTRF